MNREDVIRMAMESELIYDDQVTTPWIEDTNLTPFLERFAALIVSCEREACLQAVWRCPGIGLDSALKAMDAIRTRKSNDQ